MSSVLPVIVNYMYKKELYDNYRRTALCLDKLSTAMMAPPLEYGGDGQAFKKKQHTRNICSA